MRTVNRVFFNVATTDPTAVDVDSLHQEIDTLSLKVRQSEKELKELREENEVERLCASQAKLVYIITLNYRIIITIFF